MIHVFLKIKFKILSGVQRPKSSSINYPDVFDKKEKKTKKCSEENTSKPNRLAY